MQFVPMSIHMARITSECVPAGIIPRATGHIFEYIDSEFSPCHCAGCAVQSRAAASASARPPARPPALPPSPRVGTEK